MKELQGYLIGFFGNLFKKRTVALKKGWPRIFTQIGYKNDVNDPLFEQIRMAYTKECSIYQMSLFSVSNAKEYSIYNALSCFCDFGDFWTKMRGIYG